MEGYRAHPTQETKNYEAGPSLHQSISGSVCTTLRSLHTFAEQAVFDVHPDCAVKLPLGEHWQASSIEKTSRGCAVLKDTPRHTPGLPHRRLSQREDQPGVPKDGTEPLPIPPQPRAYRPIL